MIAARHLDFADAVDLFEGGPLYSYASPRIGEERWVSVGAIDGRPVAVVWCWRAGRVRVITMRRARHVERRTYQALFGG